MKKKHSSHSAPLISTAQPITPIETIRSKTANFHQTLNDQITCIENLLHEVSTQNMSLKKQLAKAKEEAERSFKQNQNILFIHNIFPKLKRLEKIYYNILNSKTWKIGGIILWPITILSPKKSNQSLPELFKKIYKLSFKTNILQAPPQKYYSILEKIEGEFRALFASKRWRYGSWIVKFINGCLNQEGKIGAREQVANTFEEITLLKLKKQHQLNDLKKLPKLSVIVPVFNKEKYLTNCLSSILENGYRNIEVICVDDCSTDSSKDILLNWAQRDKRIKPLFLSQNSGASVARNRGIRESQGEYLFFTDADDLVVKGSFLDLIVKAIKFDSDIVRGKITGVTDKGRQHPLAAEHLLHQHDAQRVKWKEEESLWFYWYFTANLYKSSFLKEQCITFPTSIRNEDPYFLCRCFLTTTQITLHNKTVYQYRIGAEQKNKTPSYSFLKGWAMGNYYLTQLLQGSEKPLQYFLCHFPSLENHSQNIVKRLEKKQALGLLKYLKLMFSKLNINYLRSPQSQPWERKKRFKPQTIELVENIQNKSTNELYLYLKKKY